MTPLAHLSTGYIIYKVAEAQPLGLASSTVLGLSMLGAFAPDIDGFFGRKMNKHRYTIFHTPFLWIFLFVAGMLFDRAVWHGMLLFSIGAIFHLFLDWVSARTCGVMLFYPFSKRPYSLFSLKPELGNMSVFPNKSQLNFWKHYFDNKMLVIVELFVVFLGLGLFLVNWFILSP